MTKQSEFNSDMERYLEKSTDNDVINRIKKQKPIIERPVSELYPELESDPNKIHIIEKEKKGSKVIREYKKKILSMLKKEEKEIEDMPDDDNEEEIEEIEQVVKKEIKEQVTFMQRFKGFFSGMFSPPEKIDEEEFVEPVETQKQLDEIEEIEEEIEEEKVDEELLEKKKFGSWIRSVFLKLGLSENQPNVEEEVDEVPVKKVVLYKAKLENDTRLALMIADKYIKELPMGAKDKFEKSGDKKIFDDLLMRLKIK